jgi:hypothetical protein
MQQTLLKKFTSLGDPTLLLCASLAVFLYLWSADERRAMTRAWAIALSLSVLLVVTSKLLCYLLSGYQSGALRIRSPSGHVAIATTFYGCIAIMLAVKRSLSMQLLMAIGTATLLVLLAASRMMLELHTLPEILIAFAIGAFCMLVFRVELGGRQFVMLNAGQVIALLLLVDVTHYARVDGEALIERVVEMIGHPRTADASAQQRRMQQSEQDARRLELSQNASTRMKR